jgi:hypothetical protein
LNIAAKLHLEQRCFRLQQLRDVENSAQEPQAAPCKGIEDEDEFEDEDD